MTKPTESELVAKGLTAPRVTPERIAHVIVGEYFHVPPGTTLTLCVLTLRNGFTVTGESACASPENFDREIGERYAREAAKSKVWALEGYALRERLSRGGDYVERFLASTTIEPTATVGELISAWRLYDDAHAGLVDHPADAQGPRSVAPPNPPNTARERAVFELAQLDARLEGLNRFMGTDRFRELPTMQQMRLDQQRHHMSEYSNVLSRRLADWAV
jgi:hypothetical protein